MTFAADTFFSSARRLATLACVVASLVTERAGAETFYVDYSPEPSVSAVRAHDLSILAATAKIDLAAARPPGGRLLAYLSLAEAGPDSPEAAEVKARGVKVLATNDEWNSRLVDFTSPAWREAVTHLARQASERGFDGFFLDTVDSWKRVTKALGEDAAREGMTALVRSLRETFPKKHLVINRGFELLPALEGAVDGVLVESVYRTADARGTNWRAVPEADTKALEQQIAALRAKNVPVHVLDYVPPGDAALAAATVEKIRALGAEPFLSTPQLHGERLGPLVEQTRRILVIHGAPKSRPEDGDSFAADSFTAERLQMALEWMGYEVEYFDISRRLPPERLDARFCGIVFDAETTLPYAVEGWYVNWVLAHRARGVKTLFVGQYPFQQDVERNRLFRGLGLTGTFKEISGPRNVQLAVTDEAVMNAEAPVTRHTGEIFDLRAPADARVALAVACLDETSARVRFDAVFTTDWGGVLLDPYTTFQASAEDTLSLFEPFAFLGRIWPENAFPVPDPTTRDGRRMFYSHIDGDGFAGVSAFDGQKLCGEIIRDRILKAYPFPITCSLIEAEVRAVVTDEEPENRPRYEAAARAMFELPNVQAASHAYAHPYVWIDNDLEYIPLYDERMLELAPSENYTKVDPEREIAGSIRYIQTLLPEGKKCDLMLWSGNCRPGNDALAVCERLGIENLNGGNTVVTREHPSVTNVAPRVMQWGSDRLQVHTSMQNEFVYTNNWSGPFYGGFARVIDTFERTAEPRRLKPVNVYYHFYSAAQMGSLKALQRVYDWCLREPLHSVTARQFCRIVRDSRDTAIFRHGPRAWRLVSRGENTTFRLPKSAGRPDLDASRGITGWAEFADWLYVHTDGRPVVDLTLADAPAPRLHLRDSMAEVTFDELTAATARFRASDFRPDWQMTFAGVPAGSKWHALVAGKTLPLTADANGCLRLTLGGSVAVTLEPETVASSR